MPPPPNTFSTPSPPYPKCTNGTANHHNYADDNGHHHYNANHHNDGYLKPNHHTIPRLSWRFAVQL